MTANALAALGLSEKDVVDTYIYVLARYLVVRQERIDRFQKDPDCHVFIGQTIAAGTAITLTRTLDVLRAVLALRTLWVFHCSIRCYTIR